MSATTFANPTDVVNVSFTVEDYPYEQDEQEDRPRQSLQGRVITIDTIGIVLASNGDNIMPSFNHDGDELTLPNRGDLFPWAAIKKVAFVATGADYVSRWRWHRAKETVFMDANNGRRPASNTEYLTWERSQDREGVRRLIQDVVDTAE